jgi:hypothetical protein
MRSARVVSTVMKIMFGASARANVLAPNTASRKNRKGRRIRAKREFTIHR